MAEALTRRALLAYSGGMIAGALSPTCACAQAAPARSVRITAALRAATHAIAWIGTEAGVFRKHGLEVTFPRLEMAGPDSVAGLKRGDWDFAQTGTVPVAEDVLNGGDAVVLLRNSDPNVDLYVVTRREITGLDQLAGHKVGVLSDAYSGQTGVKTRLAIEKAGVTSATYVGLGTYRNIYDALVRGEVDAGALPVHLRLLGQRQHNWNAFETAFSVPSVFATTRRFIANDRSAALASVRGFVETIHLFKTSPAIVVPLLQRFLEIDDRAAAEQLQAFYAPLFPKIPRPELASGMAGLRAVLERRYPRAVSLQETDITDASLIDEVVAGGFIQTLYGA